MWSISIGITLLSVLLYYRRFIKDFANIAKPLHRLTENASKFVWTTDCQQAFGKLRLLLSQAPVLAHPNFKNSFTLDTDASDNGIGAVLSQIGEDGEEHVIAYGSRLLTKPERNYCVTRKELLAVVYFVEQYRPYLLGQEFTLRTDHGCLTWLRNFKDPEGQLARWLEKLQEFDFTIVHRQGRSHSNADALSRLPCSQCGRATHEQPCHTANILTTDVRPPAVQTDDLRAAQLADPLLGPLLLGKESGHKPTPLDMGGASRYTRRLIQIWDQLQLCNGVLCRLYAQANDQKNHVQERFYWPGHYEDVRNWCQTCAVCASRKAPSPRSRAPLIPIKMGYPLQMVAMDIMGPFPISSQGNRYLLVVSDYFTRWVQAFGIPDQLATTVAHRLTNEIFFRFGLPEQLHSDQGRNFESDVISEICRLLEIVKTRTTPYHPQSDGLVERVNRTLLSMMAMAASDHPNQWESHLRSLCMAYKCSIQATTGYTPFYLMFGRQAKVPIDLMYGAPSPSMPVTEYAVQLKEGLEKAYQQIRHKMGCSLKREKHF